MKNANDLANQDNDGSELMPEVVGGKVDARSVHEALEVATPFDKWMPRRIGEIGFVEGEDFSTILSKTPLGGRPRTDYILSIDMAKELAMLEKTEMGRKMRRYFIECERLVDSAKPGLPDVGGFAPGMLGHIQAFNNAVAAELGRHVERIEKLESSMRPGPDWMSVKQFVASKGYEWNCGRRSKFAMLCSSKSAVMGFPIGRARDPRKYGQRSGSKEVRTYAPAVLEAVHADRIESWLARDARDAAKTKGGEA